MKMRPIVIKIMDKESKINRLRFNAVFFIKTNNAPFIISLTNFFFFTTKKPIKS